MKALTVVVALATLIVMAGCSGKYENSESAAVSMADSVTGPASSSAVQEPIKDTARKFIRTSDLKFRVKDVAQATYQIEDITRNANGFVTYTHLESATEGKEITQMSLDSSLETIRYTVVNDMTIRVPNVKLDSTLKAIAGLVDFLEYRTIKADDVALQIKSNQKAQTRALGNGQRVRTAIDNRGKKLNETTQAEELALERQRQADDAELSNLSLMDQVSYSTVKLSLYQRSEAKQWVIANDNGDKYRPGVGLRLWESIKIGWHFVEDVFVFLMRLWLLILLGIAGFIIYRKYRTKKVPVKA
jgi:hypothetical protein